MLSPTKEKGSGFGNKLHKIQNMLHHRPRSGSFGHKEKDKTEKNNNRKYIKYQFYFSICSCISFLYSPMITFVLRMPPTGSLCDFYEVLHFLPFMEIYLSSACNIPHLVFPRKKTLLLLLVTVSFPYVTCIHLKFMNVIQYQPTNHTIIG